MRTILERPQPLSAPPIQRLFRTREPLLLTPDARRVARRLARAARAVPRQRARPRRSLPIATPAEVLASLTIVSLDPDAPDRRRDARRPRSRSPAQAALAIDNARLYQQQKDFADTMQRSLLPRRAADVAGLELGEVYESAARVDVGGDVYDFLELPDGRLAVAVGDVTGHGIEATADMAMARFTFRSLAREHPEPGDFLAHANDVVAEEIARGKFITMAYVACDPVRGEVALRERRPSGAEARPPDGTVEAVERRGIALGIDPGRTFDEVDVAAPPGATIILYTDGVIEARRDRELYGTSGWTRCSRAAAALSAGASSSGASSRTAARSAAS